MINTLALKILLCIVFTFLNIYDIISTKQILSYGGFEANPFVKIIIKLNLFIPIKIIVNLIIIALIILSPTINTGLVCCGVISIFAINNCYQLYRYSKEL